MEHIGIDLGARKSHVVVMDGAETVLHREVIPTVKLGAWLASRSVSRVVMEACTQSPALTRLARVPGHAVVVVPGSVVRALGVGARGIKTDERDAEVLARASVRLPHLQSVHLRSERSTHQREICAARATLVKSRTMLSNAIKGYLRGQLIVLQGRASSDAFCDAVRTVLLERAEGMPQHIDILLTMHRATTQQIEALQESIEQMASEDPRCANLMSVPGVGPHIALAFVSTLDEVERFESSTHLASFLALTPGESTTGGKIKRTGTIKAGPRVLKSLLVQGAWSMMRSRPEDPAVLWARAIADKRGKRIAVIALARKMACVMYAMWKHDTAYDALRASTMRAP